MCDRTLLLVAMALGGMVIALGACGRGDRTLSSPDGAAPSTSGDFRYVLRRPDVQDRPDPTPGEQRWRTSLVENLGHTGEVLTFLRVRADVLVNGAPMPRSVYQNTRHPAQFHVAVDHPVIVDFRTREIGTSGVSGISFHPHPDGRMVVALLPYGVDVLGITLSSPKAGAIPWEVTPDAARWTW